MEEERPNAAWWLAAAGSGAIALGYEACWTRRLSVILGGTATGQALGIAAFLSGLAIGAAVVSTRRDPRRAWAALELAAAAAALALPVGLAAAPPALAPVVVAVPAVALGGTWAAVAPRLSARAASAWYAANTAGAAAGVLWVGFVSLPAIGVTYTEWALAGCAALLAIALQFLPELPERPPILPGSAERGALFVAAGTGFCATGLEVAWFRWAAVGLGATVMTFALVLATFLAAVATGAAFGQRWPADPRRALPAGLCTLALLALGGSAAWGLLPYGLGVAWDLGGESLLFPFSVAAVALTMGGAPALSGWVFAALIRDQGASRAPGLYAANTVASIAAAALAGTVVIPTLGLRGAVLFFAAVPVVAALGLGGRLMPATAVLAGLLLPPWDARLYAVGLYLRVTDFADASPRAIRRFADEGWDLLAYEHGQTGAIAVGESRRTGNRWLSINGKVDASTGDDMPTQVLSGRIPTALAGGGDVAVVGLASGVTAGAVLADPRVRSLIVLEIEPAVVRASHWFDNHNGRPLDDRRTALVVADARRWLAQPGPLLDVIISEPSNPWITGVSSLFTQEYWQTGRARLRPGGVFCQWVQLYGLESASFRAIVRTFQDTFPETTLYETIPGSDVLLLGSVRPRPDPVEPELRPRLSSAQVRWLAGEGWRNTDDHPQVEWRAARTMHEATGTENRILIEAAAQQPR